MLLSDQFKELLIFILHDRFAAGDRRNELRSPMTPRMREMHARLAQQSTDMHTQVN
jgi:hypothetical protein